VECRVCNSRNLESVIDLGSQPWCNHFLRLEEVGKEPFYPLRVLFCHDCTTAQLDYTVKKEIMFGDHTYLSGVTKSLSKHFEEVAQEIDQQFGARWDHKSVLDIGSNDGTQLKHFQALGYEVIGVESSKTTAKMANDAGVPTLNEFFNEELVQTLNKQYQVINASGVFFHLEELHSVCRGIKAGLADDGVFVVQFLYMPSIVENLAFDQIYHEHLLYYSLQTINTLLQRHELEMFDARLAPIHGGSMIAYVSHAGKEQPTERLKQLKQTEQDSGFNAIETYQQFDRDIKKLRLENQAYLQSKKAQSKTVYAMGAPVKGNTLLNYFNVGPDLVQGLVEINTLRKGLYSPGMHIPILMEDELPINPDVYYVLAWNFKQEILKRYADLIEKGVEFYFPVNPKISA
jgi:SAM-dependent methyltransferase